jgi:hypothetical protein
MNAALKRRWSVIMDVVLEENVYMLIVQEKQDTVEQPLLQPIVKRN